MGDFFNLQAGKFIQASDIHEKSSQYPYPCYGGNGIRGFVSSYNRDGSFPVIGRQGALCGNINYASGKIYATEHAVVVESYGGTNVDWARYLLEGLNLNQYATATAQPGLSVKTINEVLIPIPPAKEQTRIAVCLQASLESVKILEDITTSLIFSVSETKSKLLDLAIHGKLVPQDSSDEPAIELLRRINPSFKPSDNLHYAGTIPSGWQVCHLSDIFDVTMGQSPDGNSLNKTDGIEFHQGKICFAEKYLSKSNVFTSAPTKEATSNSLLCCVRAPVGVFNITQRTICIGRGLCALTPRLDDVELDYWFYALSSYKDYYEEKATGTTFKAISGEVIRRTIVLLPPRLEQRRIIIRITELFSLLDQVSNSINGLE